MEQLVLHGVPITFPFKPYDVQVAYMEKVIECLQTRQNGILESPTGTGKTLSLLCASCAWLVMKKAQLQAQLVQLPDGDTVSGLSGIQEKLSIATGAPVSAGLFGFNVPKIIYATRTHSQLSQVVQELKRTCYKHFKVSVIGSREQMCIHPEVSKETSHNSQLTMCRLKVRSKTCHYYNNVESKKETIAGEPAILDIEDLVKMGKKHNCCPYYLSREIKKEADIIFMPYNYILDSKTRTLNGIEVENCVIILDEAHNIEKMCEDSASIEFSNTDIALCIDEVTQAMKDFVKAAQSREDFSYDIGDSTPKDFSCEELAILKALFLELEKAVDAIPLSSEGSTFDGDYIFELLAKADLTTGKIRVVLELLDKVIQYLSTTSASPFQRKGVGLQKFCDLMTIVFGNSKQTLAHMKQLKQCYKVHVSAEVPKNKPKSDTWLTSNTASTSTSSRVINYWCFSSKFSMERLHGQGVHCVVFTSGTLAPIKPLISELGIPVGVQLINKHIVGPSQVMVAIVPKGPDKTELNSSYKTRTNSNYISSLGRTIFNFSRIIPDGLLVFFPSYGVMKTCKETWEGEGLWASICSRKPIFTEPRNKEEFATEMSGYYSAIQNPSTDGACFMAVTRGKVSEGLDFADYNGRAVIIVGLPYPPFKDPRIVLKRAYLDAIRTRENEYLSGQDWYQLEAIRAVNQAVGRVIRHAKDYGIILLCDCRFNSPHIKKQLSAWLQPFIQTYPDFGTIVKHIRLFFRNAEKTLPSPRIRSVTDFSSSLPPVAAQFDTAVSRSRIHSQTPTNPSDISNLYTACSPQDYRAPPAWKALDDSKNTKPQGFFELLEKSASATNFNKSLCTKVCGQDEKGCGKSKADEQNFSQPSVKRKKLKLIPLKFGPLSYVDNEDEDKSVNWQASTSRSRSPLRKVCLSDLPDSRTLSAQNRLHGVPGTVQESPRNNSSVTVKSEDSTGKASAYIREVKKKLNSEAYQTFMVIIKEYKKESNYDRLIQELEQLFCISEELFPLFSGFHYFLRSHHKKDFEAHCTKLAVKP